MSIGQCPIIIYIYCLFWWNIKRKQYSYCSRKGDVVCAFDYYVLKWIQIMVQSCLLVLSIVIDKKSYVWKEPKESLRCVGGVQESWFRSPKLFVTENTSMFIWHILPSNYFFMKFGGKVNFLKKSTRWPGTWVGQLLITKS